MHVSSMAIDPSRHTQKNAETSLNLSIGERSIAPDPSHARSQLLSLSLCAQTQVNSYSDYLSSTDSFGSAGLQGTFKGVLRRHPMADFLHRAPLLNHDMGPHNGRRGFVHSQSLQALPVLGEVRQQRVGEAVLGLPCRLGLAAVCRHPEDRVARLHELAVVVSEPAGLLGASGSVCLWIKEEHNAGILPERREDSLRSVLLHDLTIRTELPDCQSVAALGLL
mmetsp:Transcript_2993/g.6123  ORF Transcript_2993/g.6123 Transcript_2993/m.6123 type:complete len:222 (-) Transcript_2993:257-922(-)